MTIAVAILTTGSEVLDGRVIDTNSNFAARKLSEIGVPLTRVLAVDDKLPELLEGLAFLHTAADVIITSGGLGPTADDLTRYMAAEYVGVELVEFPEARAHLETYYSERNRVLDPSNLLQALLPEGGTMIPNPCGTAPGFIVNKGETKLVCCLSGVPREFQAMLLDTVLPLIKEKAQVNRPIHRAGFRLFGKPESVVGKEIVDLKLHESVSVSYRAAFPEVHLVLKGENLEHIKDGYTKVTTAPNIAPFVYSDDIDRSLSDVVLKGLIANNETVSFAESCTGGMLGGTFVQVPDASKGFLGGIVAYSNRVKVEHLQVSQTLLDEQGAVCKDVAVAMAHGVRSRFGSTYGVSITGIAGPLGGSEGKPVGTFFVALASSARTYVWHCLFVNDRASIQKFAAFAALDLLRRVLSSDTDVVFKNQGVPFSVVETYVV